MSDRTSPGADTREAPRDEGPRGHIGPYKILQQIGEGGFGAVFEAEQSQPVKRRVALKIIKLGMDTREVIARFEAERQALAMMDHPHIARVLDAGATESGRPYFVMELVKGEPISNYSDKHQLSIIQRLELFEQVCQAVQHAHTKGIIHRDLKPNNILVSTQQDRAFAKVIDFGIAKATSSRLTDKTLFTGQHQMIGTPLYMSPEQAEGSADIDTRTDIYSLGVLLYELLTGTTPFESTSLRSAAFEEIQRIIREVEPPRPSTRLSQSSTAASGVAAHRRTEHGKLTRVVRGELDWIVMKAIDKERARRYETANGLANDVRRYLDGQPVLAAPPSSVYRLRKFVRRNKVVVSAALLVTLALLIGITGFAWQARIAQERATELEQVSQFQAEMLAQVDPTQAGVLLSADVMTRFEKALKKEGVEPRARANEVESFARQWQRVNKTDVARALIDRTILMPAVDAIDKQFSDQPVVDAALRQTLAGLYTYLGSDDAAMPLQERALATRRATLGDQHPDTVTSISHMGSLLMSRGQLTEAEPFYREALQLRHRGLGERHPATLRSIQELGLLLHAQGKSAEAEPFYRQALELRRKVLGEQDPDTIHSINNMGFLLRSQGKLAEAEPFYRDALEKSRRVLGEEHRDTLVSLINMGGLLLAQGNPSGAEPYFREAVEKYRRVLGEEHPHTLNALSGMGYLLHAQGKLSEAQPYLEEALEKRRRVLGEAHHDTLMSISSTAALRVAQGRHADASALLGPAEDAVRTAFTGANAFRLAKVLMNLGRALASQGEFSQAEAKLLEAQAIFVQSPGQQPKDRGDCIQAIVDLYTAWHAAQSDQGYDIKAAEWRRTLDQLDAASPAPPN